MDFCKYSQQEDTKKKEEENRKLSRLKRLRRLKTIMKWGKHFSFIFAFLPKLKEF